MKKDPRVVCLGVLFLLACSSSSPGTGGVGGSGGSAGHSTGGSKSAGGSSGNASQHTGGVVGGTATGGAGGAAGSQADAATADANASASDASTQIVDTNHPPDGPYFKAIMWSVNDPWHFFMKDAKAYIEQLGKQYNFQADYSEDLTKQTDTFLAQYQVYINLNIEVTPLNAAQKTAFEGFINAGKGWVGFHMAGNNKQDWPWYDTFLGGCRFTGHPEIQKATLNVEDTTHPASKNLPSPTWQLTDEFYEFDKSPRPNVRVLASLDEKTYKPAKAMGDHPYVWCNEKYPKTIYIGLGHEVVLWTKDQNFRNLVRDAILWAGGISDKAPATTPAP
jgi:type 1 glutamine amidotransferase